MDGQWKIARGAQKCKYFLTAVRKLTGIFRGMGPQPPPPSQKNFNRWGGGEVVVSWKKRFINMKHDKLDCVVPENIHTST